MRVAVIGTGFGRRVVAPVFAETPDCEVAAVVSARDEDAVAAAVADATVDLVSVHSPPFLHAAHVRAALAAGKAVLCDKPFALDASEAAELDADAAAAGVVALCNFEFRYAPARALLRELVHDGTLGAVEHVQWIHCSAGSRRPLRPWGWLFDRAQGGGWAGAWGSHAVDTLRYVFGTEIAAVEGRRRIAVHERPDADGVMHECTAEDGFSASLLLANGATAALDSGFAAVTDVAPRLTVFGSRAAVEIVADARVVVRNADGTRQSFDPIPTDADPHLLPMRRLAEVARDAVHSGDVPAHAPTVADGRACDAVLDAVRALPLTGAGE